MSERKKKEGREEVKKVCFVSVLFYFVGFVILIRDEGERRERKERVVEKSGSGTWVPQVERATMNRRGKGMYVGKKGEK